MTFLFMGTFVFCGTILFKEEFKSPPAATSPRLSKLVFKARFPSYARPRYSFGATLLTIPLKIPPNP